MCVFLVAFYYLAVQNDPGSSCTYCAQVLKSAISPEGSFFWFKDWYRHQDLRARTGFLTNHV